MFRGIRLGKCDITLLVDELDARAVPSVGHNTQPTIIQLLD